MVFPKKLSIFINFPLEFYERWDAAVVLKSPSRYIDYRASSTFRSLFLDAEGYRGKKLYTARKLVEDGRESCGVRSDGPPPRVRQFDVLIYQLVSLREESSLVPGISIPPQLPLITDSSVFHTRSAFEPWPDPIAPSFISLLMFVSEIF